MIRYKNRLQRLTDQLGFDEGGDDIHIVLCRGDETDDEGEPLQHVQNNRIPPNFQGDIIVRWAYQ